MNSVALAVFCHCALCMEKRLLKCVLLNQQCNRMSNRRSDVSVGGREELRKTWAVGIQWMLPYLGRVE